MFASSTMVLSLLGMMLLAIMVKELHKNIIYPCLAMSVPSIMVLSLLLMMLLTVR